MKIYQFEYGLSPGYYCPKCGALCDFKMNESSIIPTSTYVQCGKCHADMTETIYGKKQLNQSK